MSADSKTEKPANSLLSPPPPAPKSDYSNNTPVASEGDTAAADQLNISIEANESPKNSAVRFSPDVSDKPPSEKFSLRRRLSRVSPKSTPPFSFKLLSTVSIPPRFARITFASLLAALLFIVLAAVGVFPDSANPLILFGASILMATIAFLHIAHRVMYMNNPNETVTLGTKWRSVALWQHVAAALAIGAGVFMVLLPVYFPAFGVGTGFFASSSAYFYGIGSVIIALTILLHAYVISRKNEGESIRFQQKAKAASWMGAVISSSTVLLTLFAFMLINANTDVLSGHALWNLTAYNVILPIGLALLSFIAVAQLINIIATPVSHRRSSNTPRNHVYSDNAPTTPRTPLLPPKERQRTTSETYQAMITGNIAPPFTVPSESNDNNNADGDQQQSQPNSTSLNHHAQPITTGTAANLGSSIASVINPFNQAQQQLSPVTGQAQQLPVTPEAAVP